MQSAALFLLAFALESGAAVAQSPQWRSIATVNDRSRIREWRTAWVKALGEARASGHAAEIVGEGALLQPDAAIDWSDPPAGDYACRVIRLGAQNPGTPAYWGSSPSTCRIRDEANLISFAKLDGPQRPVGLFLPTGQNRMVFLGTLQLGDERRSLEYGRDQARDMAGVIERIGDQRWRLFFPYPHFQSTLDVIELVPKIARP